MTKGVIRAVIGSVWTIFFFALAAQPDPAALARLYEAALAAREKQFGPEHPKTARGAADLGLFLRNTGDRARAAEMLHRALRIDEQAYAADHPQVLEDLENLASVLPPAEALPLIRKAAEAKDPAVSARNLARLASMAKGEEAARLYRAALEKEEAASGQESPRVAVRLNDLALAVAPRAGLPLTRRALGIQRKVFGARHPETATTQNNVANLLLALGRVTEAEPLLRQALRVLEETLGPAHARVAAASSNLGDVLRAKGDRAGAVGWYRRALEIDERVYGTEHPEVAADQENLAGLLEELGRKEEARRVRTAPAKQTR